MMRSLYSGVSGLQNHQTRMDVIGNNISNVNTTGFKRGRVNFQDLLSQIQRGAARPNEQVGGVNPQQVGLGVNVASIDTIFTQGSLQTTGVKTDVAIQGEGFFVLREGDQNYYTRAGAFSLDADGILVNPANGMRVQGWNAQLIDGTSFIDSSATTGDLLIPIGGKDPARATTLVELASNLDRDTPEIPPGAGQDDILAGTWRTSKEIFDPYGRNLTLEVRYTRVVGAVNQWNAEIEILDEAGNAIVPNISVNGVPNAVGDNTYQVQFDNFGLLESVGGLAGGFTDADTLNVEVSFPVPDTAIPVDPADIDPAFLGAGGPGDPITQTFTIDLGSVGSAENSSTQYASVSSNKIFRQDGYGMGYLQDFRVDQSGTITGIYDNGTNRAIGQIALASFVNPGGLDKAGDNNYRVSINSGDPDVGPVGTSGKGRVVAGVLEMSNVDLAQEFTDMIVTQRGFQANSKTIMTSDQMLQELLTLKR
ncbi:MAG: flagellar hook protein FlgE [Salinispira sp.]